MTKLCCSLASLFVASAAFAQTPPALSAASRRYVDYRCEITKPPFELAKVQALIKSQGRHILPDKSFNGMSVPEKFTYTMLFAEQDSQNCDGMPMVAGEEKMIFGYVPDPFNAGNSVWSQRQENFLNHYREQVIGLIRQTIHSRQRVGVNLKSAITLLDAHELIPDMLAVYKRDRKDQDILTACLFLMRNDKFKPFLSTPTYKKLYGENASYQAYIVANQANEDLTMQRAMAFYHSKA